MKHLPKQKQKDFIVLNITDLHISREYSAPDNVYFRIMTYTVTELVKKTKPDLITVSGDFTYAEHTETYQPTFAFLDSLGIPWAPVWGNHDNQCGPEAVDRTAGLLKSCKNCLYEAGDPALGRGNYVIRIEEDGRPVEGLLMMDSHDRDPYPVSGNAESWQWSKLRPNQLDWYREQVKALEADGCHDTSVILHIPIYGYRSASEAAFRKGIVKKDITPAESMGTSCWNEGYEEAFGVQYEGIGSPEEEDGMMDLAVSLGSTKLFLCGHDHVNSTVIPYRGIRMAYGLKTGQVSYATPELNGGTILRIDETGVRSVEHVQIDISHFLKKS